MKNLTIVKSTFIIIFWLMCLTCSTIIAQTSEAEFPLEAARYKINRLASNQMQDETHIQIDGGTTIKVEIISILGTIETTVITPSGQVITPQNVGTINGRFNQTNSPELGPGSALFIFPELTKNFHYIYEFPTQGKGEYIIKFQAPSGLNQETPILTKVTWNSSIAAKLIPTDSTPRTGRPTVLSLILLNGTLPVTGANVQVFIRNPDGTRNIVNLLDNGNDETDDRSGDGIYSAEFTPQMAGKYSLVAISTGAATSKKEFTRNSLATIEARVVASEFNGTISDRGVDDNSDGLFDRIEFRLGTQTAVSGQYQAFVELKTSSGQKLIGNGVANLTNGTGAITANIPASAVRQANENGPYTIERIRLEQITETAGSQEVDRRINLGQTQPYQINQFQRPPLILTGVFSEQGIDTNGNGKFDILRVSVQVDVLTAGLYEWNMKLANADFQDISFASARGNLVAGLNNITVDFNGAQIRRSESNGPYEIRDLLLFGPQSIVGAEVGMTRPYQFTDFDEGGPNVSITLSPANANLRIGQQHTVNVSVVQNTTAVASRIVTLRILSGPNAGLLTSKTTNASGNVTFTYTGAAEGTDNLRANVTVDDFLFNSNTATATWINNASPVCSAAGASQGLIMPPDNRFVPVSIIGLTDPDGDPLTVSVTRIMQDEPTNHLGSGSNTPDAIIQNGIVSVKAERIFGSVMVNGTSYTGNGRVYHIFFTANDGRGGACNGEVTIGVPHVRTATPIDDGAIFESMIP